MRRRVGWCGIVVLGLVLAGNSVVPGAGRSDGASIAQPGVPGVSAPGIGTPGDETSPTVETGAPRGASRAVVAAAATRAGMIVPARVKPRASVRGTRTVLASGRVRVVVRSNARTVAIRYTTARKHTISRRVAKGRVTATLPKGARSISVRAKATSALRKSGWKSTVLVRPPVTPTPAPTPKPTPAPTPTPSPGAGGMTTQEAQVLALVNSARATARTCGTTRYPAVAALAAHSALVTAARAHSQDMATRDYFSHTGLDGTSPWQRMTAAGYAYRSAGENIAAGQRTPEAVMSAWLASPGHCANIMNASFRELGVGMAQSPDSTYGIYWTQDFGAR